VIGRKDLSGGLLSTFYSPAAQHKHTKDVSDSQKQRSLAFPDPL
jgi:hypothetical protein